MRQTHIGGEKVFVDFAGDTIDIFDPITVNRRWIGTPYRHPKGTPLNGEFGR